MVPLRVGRLPGKADGRYRTQCYRSFKPPPRQAPGGACGARRPAPHSRRCGTHYQCLCSGTAGGSSAPRQPTTPDAADIHRHPRGADRRARHVRPGRRCGCPGSPATSRSNLARAPQADAIPTRGYRSPKRIEDVIGPKQDVRPDGGGGPPHARPPSAQVIVRHALDGETHEDVAGSTSASPRARSTSSPTAPAGRYEQPHSCVRICVPRGGMRAPWEKASARLGPCVRCSASRSPSSPSASSTTTFP